jgi:hypothetical protein
VGESFVVSSPSPRLRSFGAEWECSIQTAEAYQVEGLVDARPDDDTKAQYSCQLSTVSEALDWWRI